jgi:hypothetical protein
LELFPFFHQIFNNLILCPLFKKLLEINVKFKLQKCAACQDLPTLPFYVENLRKKGK